MKSNPKAPRKRARTPSSNALSSQCPRSVSEELAQVTSLVERRRLQNRISQQNYRNKIRVRLEQLEAMVDASSNDEPRPSDNKKSSLSPKPAASHVSEFPVHTPTLNKETKAKASFQLCETTSATTSDIWTPMPEFSNLREEEFNSHNQSHHMHDLGISFGAHPMERMAPSLLAESVSSDFSCVSTLPSESGDYNPATTSVDPGSSPLLAVSEADQIDPRFSPMELNPDSPPQPLLDLAPRGPFDQANGQPFYPMNQPNTAFSLVATDRFSDVRVDGPVSDLTPHTHWQGNPNLRPPQTPYFSPQQYVWVPIPLSSINMSPGLLKPMSSPDMAFRSLVR